MALAQAPDVASLIRATRSAWSPLRRTRLCRPSHRPGLKPPRNIVELLERAIPNRNHTLAIGAMKDAHRKPERIGQPFFQRGRVRIGTHAAGAPHLARLLLAIAA